MTSAAGAQTTVAAESPHDVWQTIAHELRQPLSAIESIGYYLTLVLPHSEAKVREQASRIQHLIGQSNWILDSGLQLLDEAPLLRERIDLEEFIPRILAARGSQVDSRLQLQLAGNLPPVSLDPARGRPLIEGLLLLCEQVATPEHPIQLRTGRAGDRVFFEIATPAPGYSSEASLGPGAILCVMAAKRVIGAHDGAFEAWIDPEAGIRVRMQIPIAA